MKNSHMTLSALITMFTMICVIETGFVNAQSLPVNGMNDLNVSEHVDVGDIHVGAVNVENNILDVLDLKNMDVLDVLKLISKKSDVNIVAGKNVKGRVTVYLKNIAVEEALNIIVEANGWAFVKENDVLKVMTEKEYENRFGEKFGKTIETRIYRLEYEEPEKMVDMLNQLKGESGKIIIDHKSSTLVIIDEIKYINKMEPIIKKFDNGIKTQIFHLSYATPEDISSKVESVLTPDVGTVKFDERTNSMIVSDSQKNLVKIAEMVELFDQRSKEVSIEAKIIQIVLSDDHKLGINWRAIASEYHNLDIKSTFDILSATDKRGSINIGTFADDNYEVMIEALDSIGDTEILSSPHITTLNNEEAKILVGSQEPYVTTTTTTPSSGPTTVSESVTFIEVGVKLYVTPTIHQDDFITMKIKPEVSSVTKNITTSNNNTIPVVETSEAETTVMVKDGVTIVIGGLIKDETISLHKRVPVLGKIPVLGLLFGSESDFTRKTETVIFLTPNIVTGDVHTSYGI